MAISEINDKSLAASAVNLATTTVTGILPAANTAANLSPGNNLVTNGAMQVAQRGTSFTSQTGVAYHLDRWEMYGYTMGDGVYRVDQSTDAPAGFSNSNKVSCTTADASQDANNQMFFQQMIEGLNSSHINYFVSSPDTVTLSFWVKSNRTGSYSLALKLSDNGSAQDNTSTRIYNSTYSVSVANTWENKTITIVLDTNSDTKVVTNGFAMAVQFWLGGGTNRDGSAANSWIANGNAATASDNLDILGSTSNDWYITGVQLEVGTVATPFNYRSYGQESQLCKRFFQVHDDMQLRGNPDAGFERIEIYCPLGVSMRANPSRVVITEGNSTNIRSPVTGYSGFILANRTAGCTLSLESNSAGLASFNNRTESLDAEL